jgi:hypothetical protein
MSEYREYLQDRQQVMRPIYNDIFEIFSRHEHDIFEFIDEVSDKYKYTPQQILLVCRAFDIPHICKKIIIIVFVADQHCKDGLFQTTN